MFRALLNSTAVHLTSIEMIDEDIHPHCMQCFKLVKCTVSPKPGESCNIMSCPLECGAKYHACKNKEHKLLCMNEKVPCINAEYGCPAILCRKYRSKHLISCPASIIHCSEEWDRWPIHLHDKKMTSVQSQLDPLIRSHLDVALAMRDQRMLRRWCVAASQGLPVTNQKFTISASSSLWVFRKWQNSREFSYPPGLEESVCKELCKTCKEAAKNDFIYNKSNNAQAGSLLNTAFIESEGLNTAFIESGEMSDKENSGDVNNKMMDTKETSTTSKLKTSENGVQTKILLPNSDLPHCSLDDVLQLSQFGTIVYHKSSGEGSIYIAVDPAEKYLGSGCAGHQSVACQILDLKFKNPSSSPPWCLPLGLDLNLEARSQHPPSNFMYTFLCCQEFRRDEYAWHYKNVHSEIHGGLNGWLVERCPLAQYGCKFARKRFNPLPDDSRIIYNETLESFGIAYSKEEDSSNTVFNSSKSPNWTCLQNHQLVDLPFDVLQHIVRFLDSFSLSNLSLTSTLFRDICSTVLKDRGLVHLKWEKHKTKDNKICWRTSKNKRWFFSSHFSPIHTWTIDGKNNMANHLKTCPYFNRISQKKAFGYGDPKNAYSPTDKRFADPLKGEERNTTKL
ncbi:hypothetical protein JTE90_024048 [Oedothorax gibbosus]|uniref:F-box domain-containing protein n=1 Tax=Oedothorax gibbosus TaxID=931172 RepID=A0AAV6VBE0_9ARAC|nr:hypothetical protein JTE90_024048 [Oedothorax gibbosus]